MGWWEGARSHSAGVDEWRGWAHFPVTGRQHAGHNFKLCLSHLGCTPAVADSGSPRPGVGNAPLAHRVQDRPPCVRMDRQEFMEEGPAGDDQLLNRSKATTPNPRISCTCGVECIAHGHIAVDHPVRGRGPAAVDRGSSERLGRVRRWHGREAR